MDLDMDLGFYRFGSEFGLSKKWRSNNQIIYLFLSVIFICITFSELLDVHPMVDKIYMIDPCLGSRRLILVLYRDHGVTVGRKHLQRLRREPTGGR